MRQKVQSQIKQANYATWYQRREERKQDSRGGNSRDVLYQSHSRMGNWTIKEISYTVQNKTHTNCTDEPSGGLQKSIGWFIPVIHSPGTVGVKSTEKAKLSVIFSH